MCKVVINKLNLGARELGYELFDGRQVIEMTGSQIVKAVRSGEDIRGMKVGQNDGLELDWDGFFTRNLMVKSHINNFKPLVEEDGAVTANVFYIVLGSRTENGRTVYPAITTRFAREELSAEKLKALYELGIISAGAKVEGDVITLPSTHPAAEPEKPAAEPEKPAAEKKTAPAKKDTSK